MKIDREETEIALTWFREARDETAAALRTLEQDMPTGEKAAADDLLVRLLAVFSAQDVPLMAIFHAACKIYITALRLCIEQLEISQNKPKVTIQ